MSNTQACKGDLDGFNKGKACSWHESPEGPYCEFCFRWDSEDDNGWMSDFGTDEFHEYRSPSRRQDKIITVQHLKSYKTKKSHESLKSLASLAISTSSRKGSEDSLTSVGTTVSDTSSMVSSAVLVTPTSPTASEPNPFPLPQVKNVSKNKTLKTECWRNSVPRYTLV